MKNQIKIKIYSGLSLSKKEIHKILPNAHVCGPVERAQIYDDIKSKVNVIGIIDGRFMQSLAVSPTEILDGIRSGIRIYGSSSIGAIRAVELESFRMIGCGEIFKYIKNLPYFRDDQLGQAYFTDLKHNPTLPYIDLMFVTEKMLKRKTLTLTQARKIQTAYRSLYFADRNMSQLVKSLENLSPNENWAKLLTPFFRKLKTQKTLDGISLLRSIKSDLSAIEVFNRKLNPNF